MNTGRLTGPQLDAYERRWKFILFACAVALVADLAYIVGTHPRGLGRFVNFLVIAACVVGCALALRRLHNAGLMETKAGNGFPSDEGGDVDISDIIDTVAGDD